MKTDTFILMVRKARIEFNRTEVYIGREMKAFYVDVDTYKHLLDDKPPELYIEVKEEGIECKLFGKPLYYVRPGSFGQVDYFDFSSGRR